MEQSPPSPAVNHSHAILNALRAAVSGEEARSLTRELLKLPEEIDFGNLDKLPLDYIEGLLGSFHQEETIILCLDEPDSLVVSQFEQQLEGLRERANYVKDLLNVLSSREGNFQDAARELTSFYVGHFRARESYINGLLMYAETFSLWDMKRHWEHHLTSTLDMIDDSRELLIELSRTETLSSYLIQRIYDSCVLIPASLRCQAHDMRHILYLDHQYFTFEDALFSEEDKYAWSQIGLNAEQAGYWAAYEISPEECTEWLSLGFVEPRSAGSWKVRGFDPELANIWILHGFDPSEAYLCRHGGITSPEEAERMKSQPH